MVFVSYDLRDIQVTVADCELPIYQLSLYLIYFTDTIIEWCDVDFLFFSLYDDFNKNLPSCSCTTPHFPYLGLGRL